MRRLSLLVRLLAIAIACTALHTAATAAAASASAFSFGSNFYGQTGLGTTNGNTLVATPIDASNLGGRTVTQVAAGTWHSLLLAEDGSVFSFGWNVFGQTGLGTESGNALAATPIDASHLGGRAIRQVAAGTFHSLLSAEDGTAFSFGRNELGATGLGTTSSVRRVATPIDARNLAGRAVKQVAAGNLHSLLIVVPEPGSLALAGTAAIALFGVHRRR